jgi:hypothetical protein
MGEGISTRAMPRSSPSHSTPVAIGRHVVDLLGVEPGRLVKQVLAAPVAVDDRHAAEHRGECEGAVGQRTRAVDRLRAQEAVDLGRERLGARAVVQVEPFPRVPMRTRPSSYGSTIG